VKPLRTRRSKSNTYQQMITCPISSPNCLQRQSSVTLLSYLDFVQLLSSKRVTMTSFHRVLMPGQAVLTPKWQYFHFILYTHSLEGECWGYSSIAHILIWVISLFPLLLRFYYIIRLSHLFGICWLLASHLLTRSWDYIPAANTLTHVWWHTWK